MTDKELRQRAALALLQAFTQDWLDGGCRTELIDNMGAARGGKPPTSFKGFA